MRPVRSTLRHPFITPFALVAWLATWATPAGAQPADLPRFDQQVFVTATGTDSTVARVPAFVTLLDAEDIAASSAHDIPDLLRQAGVQVTDINGSRRSYRVDLRGFGATAALNTLVLVDGRRVNQPDLSGSDWAQIPLHRVARIEVIRSNGATLFGDNASGGVINIITTGGDAPETRVGLRVGAFGTMTPEASTQGTRGMVSYAASGRTHQSDGYRENAATRGGDIGGQVLIRPSSRFELGVSAGFHGDRTGLPGSLKDSDLAAGVDRSGTVTPDDVSDVDDSYVMLSPQVSLGPRGYTRVDVSVRQRDSGFFSTFAGGEFTGDTGLRTVTVSPRVVLNPTTGSFGHTIVAGVDVTSASEDIRNLLTFGGAPDEGLFTLSKDGVAAYVRDEVRMGRFVVSGGYRFDTTDYTFEADEISRTSFDAHSGELGATARVSEQASVFVGVARSFRYPVLDETFNFVSNTVDTGLVPQASIGVEVGARVETGPLQASVAVFHQRTDDEIFFNPIGGPFGFGANENLDGRSVRTGIEVGLASLIGRVLLGGTFAVLDSGIDGGVWDGRTMPSVAARRASLQVRVPLSERLDVGLDGAFTGRRFFEGDFEGTFGEQEAFFLLDARVSYRIRRARFYADIKNLLDREYSEFGVIGGFPVERAYYPSPGVHALAGVDITF